MKGVSIPINVIIILVIGIIVMLAVVGFFITQFRNTSSGMRTATLFQRACSIWQLVNCDESEWTKIKVEGKTIKQICNLTGFDVSKADPCKKACCG